MYLDCSLGWYKRLFYISFCYYLVNFIICIFMPLDWGFTDCHLSFSNSLLDVLFRHTGTHRVFSETRQTVVSSSFCPKWSKTLEGKTSELLELTNLSNIITNWASRCLRKLQLRKCLLSLILSTVQIYCN